MLNTSTINNNNTNDIINDNKQSKRPGRTLRSRNRNNEIPIVEDMNIFIRRNDKLTIEDIQNVANQLRYNPMNIIDIGAYSKITKEPIVAILYPLLVNDLQGNYIKEEGYKPFPTTMWITCPSLHTRISKLEDQGWVAKLQEKLLGNKEFLQIMHDAHEKYSKFRWSLLTSEDITMIESKGWTPKLRDVGIAGIASFDGVKCLHCHYAHHVCKPEDNNIVGQWVEELLKTIPEEL